MSDIAELQGALATEVVSDGGGSQAALTVGITAVLTNVSGANLTDRKSLSIYNNGTVPLYWGFTSGVTTSTGSPIAIGQYMFLAVGPDTNVYTISTVASQNVRVTECA